MIAEQIKYKATGIHWTPEIPENWEQMRLKNICDDRLQYGINVPSSKYSDDGIRFLRTTDIDEDGNIIDEGIYIPKDEVEQSYLLQQGDLLFSRSGTVGRCYIHNTDNVYSFAGFLVRFRPENKLLSKWMFYYSFTKEFKYQVNSEAIVSTISNFNGNKYAALKLFFPKDENELKNILGYLDYKTQQVENFIEKKKQFIGFLKEQRQSIIETAVTKGIDENIQLKSSGQEWLGDIPINWNVRKIKFCVKLNSGKSNGKDFGDNPFQVALENIDNWTGNLIDNDNLKFEGDGNIFNAGDVLFNKLRPYLAKAYIAEKPGLCVSELLVFTPINELITSEFLFQRLMTPSFIDIVNSSTYGAKMPRANWNFIGNLKIVLPPIEEQKRIVNYIKTETATIDTAIAKTQKEIELIKEYKEALISEAVMGKKIA